MGILRVVAFVSSLTFASHAGSAGTWPGGCHYPGQAQLGAPSANSPIRAAHVFKVRALEPGGIFNGLQPIGQMVRRSPYPGGREELEELNTISAATSGRYWSKCYPSSLTRHVGSMSEIFVRPVNAMATRISASTSASICETPACPPPARA